MSRAAGLFLTSPGSLALQEFDLREPDRGEVVVRVAGCGVCHTDVSFFSGAVRTRHPLPLVLGHEISGVVEVAPPPFEALARPPGPGAGRHSLRHVPAVPGRPRHRLLAPDDAGQ